MTRDPNHPSKGATELQDLRRAHIRLNGDVRFRRVANEAVVIRQAAGEVLVVNELGARILELLEAQRNPSRGVGSAEDSSDSTVEDLIAILQQEYEPASDLQNDVLTFVDELVQTGVAAQMVGEL